MGEWVKRGNGETGKRGNGVSPERARTHARRNHPLPHPCAHAHGVKPPHPHPHPYFFTLSRSALAPCFSRRSTCASTDCGGSNFFARDTSSFLNAAIKCSYFEPGCQKTQSSRPTS